MYNDQRQSQDTQAMVDNGKLSYNIYSAGARNLDPLRSADIQGGTRRHFK